MRIGLTETERLAELHDLQILDTPRERGFDRLVFIAAQVFRTPIAAVSMVDEHRQWFKARVGLKVAETGRDLSFCAHALRAPAPLVVEDTHDDPRFRDNLLVTGDPCIRFYAGAPVRGPRGLPVGALCVIDIKPRSLSASQIAMLQSLAANATALLAARGCAPDGLTLGYSDWLET